MPGNPKKYSRPMAVLRVYMRHAVRHPVLLILMILGTIGIQTADLTVPVYLKRFFNVLALQNSTSAAYESLISIILSIGMISFFGWISRRIHIFSLMYIESKVMAELMESAFDHHEFLPDHNLCCWRYKYSLFKKSYARIDSCGLGNFYCSFSDLCLAPSSALASGERRRRQQGRRSSFRRDHKPKYHSSF